MDPKRFLQDLPVYNKDNFSRITRNVSKENPNKTPLKCIDQSIPINQSKYSILIDYIKNKWMKENEMEMNQVHKRDAPPVPTSSTLSKRCKTDA